jgi:hypothetical protein
LDEPLPFASPGIDHEGRTNYQKQRWDPGHAQIGYSMQIENSNYRRTHQEKETNRAEKVR